MEDIEETEDMPTFSQTVKNTLPTLLAQIVSNANSPEDADLLLLGSFTAFSACLPNVFGNYGGREVFPNLFLFVWKLSTGSEDGSDGATKLTRLASV